MILIGFIYIVGFSTYKPSDGKINNWLTVDRFQTVFSYIELKFKGFVCDRELKSQIKLFITSFPCFFIS